MLEFIQDAALAAWSRLVRFGKGVKDHTESVVILSLSAVGANVLIGEIPFFVKVPMFFESMMVVPILAVAVVTMLVKIAAYRHG